MIPLVRPPALQTTGFNEKTLFGTQHGKEYYFAPLKKFTKKGNQRGILWSTSEGRVLHMQKVSINHRKGRVKFKGHIAVGTSRREGWGRMDTQVNLDSAMVRLPQKGSPYLTFEFLSREGLGQRALQAQGTRESSLSADPRAIYRLFQDVKRMYKTQRRPIQSAQSSANR